MLIAWWWKSTFIFPFKFSHPIMIQPTSFIKYYWRQMAQIIDLNKFLSDGDGWDFLIDSFWTLIWRKKKKNCLATLKWRMCIHFSLDIIKNYKATLCFTLCIFQKLASSFWTSLCLDYYLVSEFRSLTGLDWTAYITTLKIHGGSDSPIKHHLGSATWGFGVNTADYFVGR